MTGDQRIGFIGLGNIGKPMAHRLTAWEGGLTVYDIDPEPMAELEQAGASVASSVADLAAECWRHLGHGEHRCAGPRRHQRDR